MTKKILVLILAIAILGINMTVFAEGVTENLYFENFEDASVKVGDDGSTLGFSITSDSNASATVQTDSRGSKALKVENGSTSDISFKKSFSDLNIPASGIVEISFDVYFENRTRTFFDFAKLSSASRDRMFSNSGYGNDFYTYNSWNNRMSIPNGTYYTVKYVLDMDNSVYSKYKDATAAGTNISFSGEIPTALVFEMRTGKNTLGATNYKCLSACTTDAETSEVTHATGCPIITPQVFWLDNITVSVKRLGVTSTTPVNESQNNEITNDIEITFTDEVSEIDSTKIKVYRNEALTENLTVSKNGNKALISKDILEFDSDYKIELETGFAKTAGLSDMKPYSFGFSTKSIIDVTAPVDGKTYTAPFTPAINQINGVTYTTTLKLDGTEIAYNIGDTLTEHGGYILSVTATDTATQKTQKKDISFTLVGEAAPVAENVLITGTAQTGEELTANYLFVDYNGDSEDKSKSIFKWYRIKADGSEEEITNSSPDPLKYTLTTADENCDIVFEVTPIAQSGINDNKAYRSTAFTGAYAPVVSDIKVTENAGVLTATYKLSDVNEEDPQDLSEISWYYCDEKGENPVAIANSSNLTYTLSDKDINSYIAIGIKPKTDNKPEGVIQYSKPILLPFAPSASEAKITGNATVGQTLGASYLFEDKNGDKESGSIIRWYVGGMASTTGAYLTVTSQMAGKTVYYEVTPCSDAAPTQGQKVQSQAVTVSSQSSMTGGGGNSVTGGGGGGGFTRPTVTPTPTPTVNETETQTPEAVGKLTDISGHWAEKEINTLFEVGSVTGDENKKYNPDNMITRAEIAAIVARAFNLSGTSAEFSDVSENEWYARSVYAVSESGVMQGADGNFRPKDYITREELCVLLANLAEKKGITGEESQTEYSDNGEISEWAKEKVNFASGIGLVNGVGENMFAPKKNATRAEVAVIICRLLDKID